jgi:hypothetical protein
MAITLFKAHTSLQVKKKKKKKKKHVKFFKKFGVCERWWSH